MKSYRQKLYLQIISLLIVASASAQESWPSPEVAQMYHHAQEYAARKDYNSAVTTYKQAILLAPGKIVLYKELGNALYLSGRYKEAEQTLSPICGKPDADAASYQVLAASQAAQGNNKDARSTLQNGLARFPLSGMLYNERGKVLTAEKKKDLAINAWLTGMEKEPAYAPNYYNASLAYMSTDKVIWGLLYGETFLAMPHDTANEEQLKSNLFTGYKKMFDGIAAGAPGFGKKMKAKPAGDFASAVIDIYTHLTPVVSDGISTENLTMVRTRFLMDWFTTYGSKYPYALFAYQDTLVKYGRFDIWNEWLFGKAESETEYDSWNKFHEGAITRTQDWLSKHMLHPVATDGYNKGE